MVLSEPLVALWVFFDFAAIIKKHNETQTAGAPMPSIPAENHNGLSGGGSVVVLQQTAETLSLLHFPSLTDLVRIRANQFVIQTLMIALRVIMRCEQNGDTN